MNGNNINTEISKIKNVFSEITGYNGRKNLENDLNHRIKFNGRLKPVQSISITPDDKYLSISYTDSPKLRVVDLTKLEFMPHKYDFHHLTVRQIASSPDSLSLYTASWDGCFMKINIPDGTGKMLFCGTRSPSVFIDSMERYLFVAEYPDNTIDDCNSGRCWDLQNNKTVAMYHSASERLHPESVDVAYDQEFVYTGSDGAVYKWELNNEQPIHRYFACSCGIRKITVSKTLVAAASNDGVLRIHKKSGELYRYITASKYEIKDVRIAKDESFIVASIDNGTIKCWSLKTFEERFSLKVHASVIWSIRLMNSDTVLVTGGTDGLINFINITTGEVLLKMYNFHKDMEMLVSVPGDKNMPNGFFYTTNKDYIEVYAKNKNGSDKILDKTDKNRLAYIDKLNLKNLIIRRLKNTNQYNTLLDNYSKNKTLLTDLKSYGGPLALQAKV